MVLSDFEEYTLTYREYGKSVSKHGIYGVVGDPKKKKNMFFVEVPERELSQALKDFKIGMEFRYHEAKSVFIGMFLFFTLG